MAQECQKQTGLEKTILLGNTTSMKCGTIHIHGGNKSQLDSGVPHMWTPVLFSIVYFIIPSRGFVSITVVSNQCCASWCVNEQTLMH
eukprot:10348721-Ditylum_brightwellii.AAC.2